MANTLTLLFQWECCWCKEQDSGTGLWQMDILSTHLQESTKEFLMNQIFSSEMLIISQTQSSVISATAQHHFLNTYREEPWHLGMPLQEARDLSDSIGAALPAVIQASLPSLPANSPKTITPCSSSFRCPPAEPLAPKCSRGQRLLSLQVPS